MTRRRGRGEGSIAQLGPRTWRLRAYAGRDPHTGSPRQLSRTVHVATKTEALKELRRFVEEVQSGRVSAAGTRATVGLLLSRYMDHLRRVGRAQTTLETYQYIINTHLVPAFGHVECRKVDALMIDDYYSAKQAEGLKPSYVGVHHSILSGAFKQAAKWGWIRANPAADATPPKPSKKKKFIPEVHQVRALIDVAADDIDLTTAVVLAALMGGRRGELCGLKWSDVDWAKGELALARQRVPTKHGDITLPLKNADGEDEVRPVSIGPLGLAVLENYRLSIIERARTLRVEPDWDGWLLSYDCGRSPIRAHRLGEAITRLGKKAKVPVTTHAFRRFAATQAVAQGADIVTIAGRMGHTPEMLLRRYAGFLPQRDAEVAKAIEVLVLGEGAGGP